MQVDPFQVASTIASYCNYVYRKLFLKSDSIAIIPEYGYNLNQRTSKNSNVMVKI